VGRIDTLWRSVAKGGDRVASTEDLVEASPSLGSGDPEGSESHEGDGADQVVGFVTVETDPVMALPLQRASPDSEEPDPRSDRQRPAG